MQRGVRTPKSEDKSAAAGSVQNGSLVLEQGIQPELGADITPLGLSIEQVSRRILRIKIGAPGRWEVPRSLFKTENITFGAPRCCLLIHICASQHGDVLLILTLKQVVISFNVFCPCLNMCI